MADKITIRVPFSQSVRALGRIGRVGENVSRRILFDCSSALSGRESATISCVIQRPSYDDPYLAPIEETEEAGVYSLTLRDVDVAIAGTVKIELRMLDGEDSLGQLRTAELLQKMQELRRFFVRILGKGT